MEPQPLLDHRLDRGLRGGYSGRYVFPEHHESHAASAFFPSPFEEAAILTLDGVGEWATAAFGVGRGNRIELTHEMRFPHSLGMLYSTFTAYLGFRVNEGEYKVMGLAAYGKPAFQEQVRRMLRRTPDGGFALDLSYFEFHEGAHRSFSAQRKYSSPCSTRRRVTRSPRSQVPLEEPRSSMK